MKLGTRALFLVAVTVGCSSANFDVTENPGADTSVVEEAGSDTGIGPIGDSEPPPPDSNVGSDVGVTEAGGGCIVPTNPAEIWVDKASTAMGATGTSTCPFRTVLEAIDFANRIDTTSARTIRVRNGIYTETAAIILRKGLTLTGAGVGLTQLTGGGPCTTSTTGYKCVVRVDGGAILERVSIDAAPNGKHGVVTGAAEGAFPTVRSTSIFGAGGSCCAGILATNGAILGPNIESSNNAYGLVIWGSQQVKILAGTNKFDNNSYVGINHEGVGVLSFEGGSVSNNAAGINLGEPVPSVAPVHGITGLIAKNNGEYGIRVRGVASAKIRNSTITGSKIGVIAIHGTSNYIDLGTAGSFGNNNFGNSTTKNSHAAVCALFTRTTPLDATGNTFPTCSAPRSLDDIGTAAGCEAITAYQDIWYRGATVPINANCTTGT